MSCVVCLECALLTKRSLHLRLKTSCLTEGSTACLSVPRVTRVRMERAVTHVTFRSSPRPYLLLVIIRSSQCIWCAPTPGGELLFHVDCFPRTVCSNPELLRSAESTLAEQLGAHESCVNFYWHYNIAKIPPEQHPVLLSMSGRFRLSHATIAHTLRRN